MGQTVHDDIHAPDVPDAAGSRSRLSLRLVNSSAVAANRLVCDAGACFCTTLLGNAGKIASCSSRSAYKKNETIKYVTQGHTAWCAIPCTPGRC